MDTRRLMAVVSMMVLAGCPDGAGDSDTGGSTGTAGDGTGTTGVVGSSGVVGTTSGQEGSGSSGGGQSSSSGGEADSTTSGADSTTGMGGGSTDTTTGVMMESSSGGGPPQNLLDNPSLETWTSAEIPNTTPDLWTNCSIAGLGVDAVPDSCTANPGGPVDGMRYARGVGGEGFEQTIDTVAGQTYEISFSYCGVDMCFGGAPNSAWDVVIDGMVVDTTPPGMGTVWSGHSLEFTATAATTTLCFRRANMAGQGGIDDLAVFLQ